MTIEHLRQLHQQAQPTAWRFRGKRTVELVGDLAEAWEALPHLLDIAEAARLECERSWSHTETPARRQLREALARLEDA